MEQQPDRESGSARIKEILTDARHTNAALIKAVEQAVAPFTLAIRSYLTIQGVLVATRCHWSSSLLFYRKVEMSEHHV
jgi:hypothetical protein